MSPLDAVAAAIRERLLAGRPAPLPGLGTLVRQHVASRIQERADGSRVLMPPGETIGLARGDAEHESLAQAFGRFLGLDGEDATRSYGDAMDQVEALLAATGEVRLPGVGLLRRTSGGVILGVEADLLAVVNRTYEGLAPVGAVPAASATPPSSPPQKASPPPAQTPPAVEVTRVSETGPVPSPPLASEPPAGIEQTAESASAPSELADRAAGSGAAPVPYPADASLRGSHEPRTPPFGPPGASQPSPFTSPPDGRQSGNDESAADPAPGSTSPADAAFVDEETLDADLDELAVPFGAGAALSDVLPTTPPEREPEAADHGAAVPDAHTPPPTQTPVPDVSADEHSAPDPVADDPPDTAPPSDAPDLAPVEVVSYTIDAPAAVGERPGPSAELSALLSDSTDEEAVAAEQDFGAAEGSILIEGATSEPVEEGVLVVEPDDPTTSPVDRKSGFPWWLVALAALLALALLLAWLWPRLADRPTEPDSVERTVDGSAPAEPARAGLPPEGVDGTGSLTQAGTDPADASALPTQPDPSATSITPTTVASGGGVARDTDPDPLPARPGLGQAPAAGYAISPPRVAGLPAADVRAMSGRPPIDPDARAWTLVVLSTASRDDATALSARYRSAGYRTGVLASDRDARPTYRVAVGQFADRDQAHRLRDRLPPQAPADSWPLDLRTL